MLNISLTNRPATGPTDTICAIATPPGGALGIIRLSGPEAIRCTAAIFQPASHREWPTPQGGTVTFGQISDPTTGELVDEVLVSLFRAPHSYTGEDCTEISCHGSAYILNRVIQLLLAQGCRLAQGGEYTQRAFVNGKMDLSQAEAVADLIASTTEANHRMAMKQLRGGFSAELKGLRDQLLHLTSLLELELDFSDHEDLEFASRDELTALATRVHERISRLCASFRVGNALKRGVPVAIVGETNAGKSTLLNALVGEERALVSDVHGTTRDTVEECIVAGGTLIRFIDTAGIRQTDDTVERMGIERTFDKMKEADLILWLIDATAAREQYEHLHARLQASHRPTLLLINKADLLDETARHELETYFAQATSDGKTANEAKEVMEAKEVKDNKDEAADATLLDAPLFMTARSADDVAHLLDRLAHRVAQMQQSASTENGVIVSNARHYEALTHALEAIDRVSEGLANGLSGDFVAQDLRECIYHLSDIAGEVTTDAVLHNIFKHFCVGK